MDLCKQDGSKSMEHITMQHLVEQLQHNGVRSGNTWYYVDAEGKMVTGYQTIAGAKYYFAESGLMQTGWFKINGADYYAPSTGAIKNNG